MSVPVLSLATSEQLPSPSTAGNWRTMAPRLAIRRAAIASAMVTATGKPSGMADTASATPKVNIVKTDWSWTSTAKQPINTAADRTTIATA